MRVNTGQGEVLPLSLEPCGMYRKTRPGRSKQCLIRCLQGHITQRHYKSASILPNTDTVFSHVDMMIECRCLTGWYDKVIIMLNDKQQAPQESRRGCDGVK